MILMLPHAFPSFYSLSDMIPLPQCVNTSILGPAHYRSKRRVSLFTAHSNYYLGTLTFSTRRISAPVANDDVDISALIHHVAVLSYSHSTFDVSWFTHNKPAASDNDHFFPMQLKTNLLFPHLRRMVVYTGLLMHRTYRSFPNLDPSPTRHLRLLHDIPSWPA